MLQFKSIDIHFRSWFSCPKVGMSQRHGSPVFAYPTFLVFLTRAVWCGPSTILRQIHTPYGDSARFSVPLMRPRAHKQSSKQSSRKMNMAKPCEPNSAICFAKYLKSTIQCIELFESMMSFDFALYCHQGLFHAIFVGLRFTRIQ